MDPDYSVFILWVQICVAISAYSWAGDSGGLQVDRAAYIVDLAGYSRAGCGIARTYTIIDLLLITYTRLGGQPGY